MEEKNNEDAYVEGRHKIDKERTHAPIRVGGLNMRRTKIKAECLYFDSGIRHIRKLLQLQRRNFTLSISREKRRYVLIILFDAKGLRSVVVFEFSQV